MSKKKKLEEGLNRLFSTPVQGKKTEPPSQNSRETLSTETSAAKPSVVMEDSTGNIPDQQVETPAAVHSVSTEPNLTIKDNETEKKGSQLTNRLEIPPQTVDSQFKDEQVVVFSLANQLFGLNIANVESIISMQPITELPRAPDYMKGVTNLRGRVVPVFSLSQRLGLPESESTKNSRIIIVNISGYDAGMVVDEVKSVSEVPGKNMSLPSDIISVDSSCVRAIASIDEKLVILLELEEIFSFQSVKR